MPAIPCPKCKTQIEFDFNDILESKQFTCTTCNIKIALSYEDNKTTLSKAQKQLDKLKDEMDID